MRKPFILVLLVVSIISFYSCKKASTISSSAPTVTKWIFNDVTYTGISTSLNLNLLNAIDSAGDEIYISFYKIPVTQRTYAVNNGMNDTSGCYMQMSVVNGGSYHSTGQQGNEVNITVTAGKITASFANIAIENYNNFVSTVSGTLIQQ